MRNNHRDLLDTIVVVTFAVLVLESTMIASQAETQTEPAPKRRVLDIVHTPHFHRLPGAFRDMLLATGQSEWSPARINAVLGIAFSFDMRKGGGKVWQEANLDWDLTCKGKREFGLGYRIQHFLAQRGDDPSDIRRVKTSAWDAVRDNINRGVPTVALCPMSADPRSARDWGLLVGYDEADSTYVIRRHGGEFTARYDSIGLAASDYCVLVYDGPKPVDANSVHVKALQNAIAFANGPTYDPKEVHFQVDAFGFEAYELWREAIESGVVAAPEQRSPKSGGQIEDSLYHTAQLRALRGYAAAYLRELVDLFSVAAYDLEQGAAHYDRVVEVSQRLQSLFHKARDAGELTPEFRAEAGDLVTAALHSERDAIASIEAALAPFV